MPLSMRDKMESKERENRLEPKERIHRLKTAVQQAPNEVCTERALLWTEYFRTASGSKPVAVRMAEALRHVLLRKSIAIYPDEWLVGNYTSKRVGGSIYPELHGVPVMLDLFKLSRRQTNPLGISPREMRLLLSIIPFWAFRFVAFHAYSGPLAKIRFIANQLRAHFYLINECGGISHLAPDYENLIRIGTDGIKARAEACKALAAPGSESWNFLEAVTIIAEGLARFGERYGRLAADMAKTEAEPRRRRELETIAGVCARCLRQGVSGFHEALQAVLFAQIAINLESLDNAVSPGRLDQYLYPYYERDIREGRLDRGTARELTAAFCIKLSEIIPVFSQQLINFHGGMFNGQVVTVGGTDRAGRDSVNELSYLFLEVMDELRMRQPNFHARVHSGAPEEYHLRLHSLLAGGCNSPALYNDDVIVPCMQRQGYAVEDARDYTAVGCVEPVSQGRSFASTDAALFNLPVVLEMALNQGRRFGSPVRTGRKTVSASAMTSMDHVCKAFEAQLTEMLGRLVRDLRAVETANRLHHPTPLTSMLLKGCIESGVCSTAGGARYNFSGIQCVAPIDVGDALYAIERAVFIDRRMRLTQLVRLLKNNLNAPAELAYLRNLPKFGNDDPAVDRWSVYAAELFAKTLSKLGDNTRGGAYTTGLYSVTAHEFFGRITGALPHGRRKGEPFASGISPVNGMDRKGPTALLNSVNRFDFKRFANGVNFNIKFDPHTLRGGPGVAALGSLLKTYFRRGGMQAQINVVDPDVLIRARDNPRLYPNLLVRVSGYSAYFNDLSPAMKEEVIRRSCLKAG
ncbi:MAG: pyruvate formate lyase family protein [Thermodesulfobacteriota bacterium]